MATFRFKFFIFYLSVFSFLACARQAAEPQAVNRTPVSDVSKPTMSAFIFENHKGPHLTYRLQAQQATLLEAENRVLVAAPFLTVHETRQIAAQKAGKIKIRAQGKQGAIDLKTKDVFFEGDVIYEVLPRSSKLTTTKLFYWAGREMTEVPEGTGYVLRTPDGVVEGSGLLAKEDLTQ